MSDGRFKHTDATFLHNPEGALEGLGFQRAGEGGNQAMKDFLAHPDGTTQDRDSIMLRWGKPEGIGEIEVQRDDTSPLATTAGGYFLIGSGAKTLRRNGADIMPGFREQVPAPLAEVFIELEFHATGSRATGTKRSWDIAEP